MPDRNKPLLIQAAAALLSVAAAVSAAFPQTIAVIDPEAAGSSPKISESLAGELRKSVRVLDAGLSGAAFRSFGVAAPFNLEASVARDIGSAVGCTHYVLVRSALNRRSAKGRALYYEAHAAYYLVSARTGRLAHWEIATFEKDSEGEAMDALYGSVPATAAILAAKVSEPADPPTAIPEGFTEAPGPDDPARPPMPYRRISPEYTRLADLHGIAATVDIEVAIAADGTVAGTEIIRWAGYGLDESVENAVRTMQWRPGERDGRFLPMRVLLRYNFRDIDDD